MEMWQMTYSEVSMNYFLGLSNIIIIQLMTQQQCCFSDVLGANVLSCVISCSQFCLLVPVLLRPATCWMGNNCCGSSFYLLNKNNSTDTRTRSREQDSKVQFEHWQLPLKTYKGTIRTIKLYTRNTRGKQKNQLYQCYF